MLDGSVVCTRDLEISPGDTDSSVAHQAFLIAFFSSLMALFHIPGQGFVGAGRSFAHYNSAQTDLGGGLAHAILPSIEKRLYRKQVCYVAYSQVVGV